MTRVGYLVITSEKGNNASASWKHSEREAKP